MNDQTVGADAAPRAPGRLAVTTRSPWLMLAMATIGFAVNFWAWALISPLGPLFRDTGHARHAHRVRRRAAGRRPGGRRARSGRILVGALTDRFGGRVMFPLVSGVTIVPVLFIAFFALDSYALLLVGGFFLGIAGTAFAVGVPVRQRLVPARAAGPRDRHLRRRHGRHRDQRADHRQARHRRSARRRRS